MRPWIPIFFCAAAVVAQQRPPAPVVVAAVVEREVTARRSFVGTVEPARLSTVGSEVAGLVVEFLVREGDRVEKGQPLARLRTRLMEIQLDAARATRELREQELAELVNGSRPEEIDEARARLGRALVAVKVRRWKLDRAEKLRKSNVISEDELDDARLLAEQADEAEKEAQAAFKLVEAGPRQERIAQARARVKEQEAVVLRLEDELERHTIRAPFKGYVVEEHTEVGQWLDKGEEVVAVAALDEVDVTVPVLEDYVLGVRVGMEITVTIDALPGRLLEGRLKAIVPKADPRARTFPVKIRLKNPPAGGGVLMKAGMFARIHVPVGETERALVVPKDALVLGGPQPVVFVVVQGSAVRRVPVTVGIAVDSFIQVKGALAPGDLVVVRGNERLQPDQRVQVTETVK
ncbi:MAG: efflux RND transporter periplasmic adaptor subunit [Planctomycetota bacterium]|jgi:multidrug efflux pump subunit AcrA (membrane-fusion protein)